MAVAAVVEALSVAAAVVDSIVDVDRAASVRHARCVRVGVSVCGEQTH